jgi:hypothetical protein
MGLVGFIPVNVEVDDQRVAVSWPWLAFQPKPNALIVPR